jgi:ATP-dependent helicase/nuclease subunit B
LTQTRQPSGLKKFSFEAASVLDDAAALIVEHHAAELPNLSAVTILVAPRAATALRHALAKAAVARGFPSLMMPTIGTLAGLASSISIKAPERTFALSERVLDIFQLLKKQQWFSPSETLALSRELVGLSDELSNNLVHLPASLAEHSRILARAYAIAKPNADFSFEAKLTYEMWAALAAPTSDGVDGATRYGMQLAAWSAAADRSLFVIGTAQYSKREYAFFEQYAERASVYLIDQAVAVTDASNAKARFFAAAFSGAPGAGNEIEKSTIAVPKGLVCYSANDIEDEATAALKTIKRWLIAGKRNIAVVALDRLAARRLRALAERDQILMSDEIGWPFSTTVSATAIMRWLEAKRDGFYFETLIDLIKSPFIFADLETTWTKPRIKAAVLLIEHAIRRASVVAGLLRTREALLRLPVQEDNSIFEDALALLDRLIEADRAFTSARRTAAAWMAALNDSLKILGLDVGLERDNAGADLLAHLANAEQDVAASRVNLSISEWMDWLRTQMEEARFRDQTIDSPIVMTSLEATRFRRFDAAILIGASAGNLPGKPANTGVFNQSVRRQLGLSTHADTLDIITHDLLGLLNRCDETWISWQSSGGSADEPASPSPWVAALLLQAKRSGELKPLPLDGGVVTVSGQGEVGERVLVKQSPYLNESSTKQALPETPLSTAISSHIASRPAPALAPGQVPLKISASGYQSLIDCPYQYFSRAVLKLRSPDEVEEEMEKRDFGEFVHDILHRFHQRFAVVTGVDQLELRNGLLEETETVFATALEQNFMARAWRLQWESAIDAYLSWQLKREEQGWHWYAGEFENGFSLQLESGESFRLEGRLDRIDQREFEGAKQTAVIDYKARAASALQVKLKSPGEDVQLPVYAALAEAAHPDYQVAEAAYLSVERNGVKQVPYPEPHNIGEAHVIRLHAMFEALHNGAPLPAQGVEKVCNFCEARGLCRRDYWLNSVKENSDD